MTRSAKVFSATAAGVAVLVIAVVALSGGRQTTDGAQATPPNTAQVDRGRLSAAVAQEGTLTYRAQPDGSPYSAVNQAAGIYTELPEAGQKVDCGDVFYRVDDAPVLLMCGGVPAYRNLELGEKGSDVRQLNRNLHRLGYDAAAGVKVDPKAADFSDGTQRALEELQHEKGLEPSGHLGVDQAVFLPSAVRIAKVDGELGGSARPGGAVAQAMSDTLEVRVNLDASQPGQVKKDDRAEVTLPNNQSVAGRVGRLGTVTVSAGQGSSAGTATIPVYIDLANPSKSRGFDEAPVQVRITTTGVSRALSVPVTAIVGRSGGGYAVEMVGSDGQRDLVPVKLGLFDTGGGRVQVVGDLHAGDSVVVPSL